MPRDLCDGRIIFSLDPDGFIIIENTRSHDENAFGAEMQGCAQGSGLAHSAITEEFAELIINLAYVKLLSKKKDHPEVMQGTIAPTSKQELQAVQ